MAELLQNYLTTPDIEQSREFYESTLNLDVDSAGESSASYDVGDAELVVKQDHSPRELEEYGLEPPREPRGEGVFLVVELEERLSAVVDRAGDSVVWGPGDAPWGGRMALVESPAGYVFELRRKN